MLSKAKKKERKEERKQQDVSASCQRGQKNFSCHVYFLLWAEMPHNTRAHAHVRPLRLLKCQTVSVISPLTPPSPPLSTWAQRVNRKRSWATLGHFQRRPRLARKAWAAERRPPEAGGRLNKMAEFTARLHWEASTRTSRKKKNFSAKAWVTKRGRAVAPRLNRWFLLIN